MALRIAIFTGRYSDKIYEIVLISIFLNANYANNTNFRKYYFCKYIYNQLFIICVDSRLFAKFAFLPFLKHPHKYASKFSLKLRLLPFYKIAKPCWFLSGQFFVIVGDNWFFLKPGQEM